MIVSRLLCLALLALSCLSGKVIGTPRAEFRQSYSLARNGHVVVQNLYGDVSITAWDRDEVLVEATKSASDPKRLNEARIVVEPSSGLVLIRTQYAGSETGHPASVEYRITVPRTANLEQIKLVNGGLSINGVAGPVKASSVNGAIRAQELGGEADLSTVNGTLEAGFNRISASNPICLSSVNGPIRLSLPAGAGASLTAHNRSGGIQSDFGRVARADDGHRLKTIIKRGGPQIRLDNVNGGISIHATWIRRGQHPCL